LAQRGAEAVGLDFSPEGIKAVRALAAVPSRGTGGALMLGWRLQGLGSVGARRPAAQGSRAARAASRMRLRR